MWGLKSVETTEVVIVGIELVELGGRTARSVKTAAVPNLHASRLVTSVSAASERQLEAELQNALIVVDDGGDEAELRGRGVGVGDAARVALGPSAPTRPKFEEITGE